MTAISLKKLSITVVLSKKERQAEIKALQQQMQEAAELLDFELAAQIRDVILELKAID